MKRNNKFHILANDCIKRIINKTSITFHFLDNVLSNMFILQTLFTSITYKLQIHDLIILRRELNRLI